MVLSSPHRTTRPGGSLLLRAALSVLLLAVAVLPAFGQDVGGDEGAAWQVARLRVTEGTVYILPEGGQEWDEAEGNVSLAEGDRVSVPDDAAALLSYRGHETLLSGGTDLSVVYLREERAAYRLSEGRARFRLTDYDFVPVRVSLPSGGRVRMTEPGSYRISIGEEEEAVVRVARGEAVVSDPEGGKVRIRTGQQAFVGEVVRVSRYDEPPPPEDVPPPLTEEERAVEAPPAVVYELRDYGDWVVVGDFGYVWRPRVAVGWSPFFYGNWSWSLSLGWYWSSYEPWGWYPYHCGRWHQDRRFGWVWVPRGAFTRVVSPWNPRTSWYRPVRYYPATVRVVREGGNVRWVPLAPRERYVRPAIRRGDSAVYRYSRPLPPGTVYSRDWSRGSGRGVDSWRGVEPGRGRTVGRPRDDRPVYRIGDPNAPFRGDRAVSPVRPARPRDGGGVERRIRERREPRVAPAPGRRGGAAPERREAEPPGRRSDEAPGRVRQERGRIDAPPAAPAAPPPPPPGRVTSPGRTAPPTAPAASPPPPPGRVTSPGRTAPPPAPAVAPPPGRAPAPGRGVAPAPGRPAPEAQAPPARGLRDVRPILPPSRGGGERGGGEAPSRPDRGGGHGVPEEGRGGARGR